MSYCRFGSGDVYMYGGGDKIHCCMCIFTFKGFDAEESGDPAFSTRSEALAHLHEHRNAGHRVPQHAVNRLEREIRDTGEDATLNPWAVYKDGELPDDGEA